MEYKGIHLSKNSVAYELHKAGKLKELDQHLKEVETRQREQMAKIDKEDLARANKIAEAK